MVKGEVVVMRVSEEEKTVIAEAAGKLGKSATRFVVDAALKEARAIAKKGGPRGVHTGAPSYLKALCFEAAQGGAGGYSHVGYRLAAGVGAEQPHDVEENEWADEVEKLSEMLDRDDSEPVWRWFRDHYPKIMALVPTRRREQFLAGVREAHQEGLIEL